MPPPMLDTNLIDEFDDDQLQNVTECLNLVNAAAQVVQRSFLLHKNHRLQFLSQLKANKN